MAMPACFGAGCSTALSRALLPQRSMCAISSLVCSDLLAPDQIFAATRQRLQQLSQGSPGPVANRAMKVSPGVSLCPLPGAGGSWGLACPSSGTPRAGEGSVRVPEGWELWSGKPRGGMLPPRETRLVSGQRAGPQDSFSAWEKVLGLSPRPSAALTLPVPLFSSQLLRQFEALCRDQPSLKATRPHSDPSILTVGTAPCTGDLLTDVSPPAGESLLPALSAAPLPVPAAAPGQEQGLEAEPPGPPSAVVPAWPREEEVAGQLAGSVTGATGPSRSLSLFAGMELVARPSAVLCPDSPPAEPRTLSQPQDRWTDPEGSQEPSAFAFLNV